MHNPFKGGDKLLATSTAGGMLKPGKVYTVRDTFNEYVIIDERYENGSVPTSGVSCEYFRAAVKGVDYDVQPDMILPGDPAERKGMPITTGVLDYFPLAIAEVAKCSKAGNDQHNPGQPLHWDKTKSTDHADCIPRHLIDRYSYDTDGVRHAAKLAWRALAFLQTLLEQEQKGGK